MMRTPAETLQRLAEVAPKGWGTVGIVDNYALSNGTDIENGIFTAWCKAKLWGSKYADKLTVDRDAEYTFVVSLYSHNYHHRCYDLLACASGRTEWQAVAECLIAVLEKEND